MSEERTSTGFTFGEIISSAEYVHRNQEAKTWLIRGISLVTSILVFGLSSWAKGHLPWLESEVPNLIKLAQTLAGGSFVLTMGKGAYFFLSRRKPAGVVDARKRQVPEHIKIAKQDDGTFWIINSISGECIPVRSDNDYDGLVPELFSTRLPTNKIVE